METTFSKKLLSKLTPPRCPRDAAFTTADGRPAPFFWLRDPKRRKDRDAYVKNEVKYARDLNGSSNATQTIFTELKAREPELSSWIPYRRKNYNYTYVEDNADAEHGAYLRRHVAADPLFIQKCVEAEHRGEPVVDIRTMPGTEVIIDLHATAENEKKDFVSLGELTISPDERRALMTLDMSDGREIFTLLVLEFNQQQQQQEQPPSSPISPNAASSKVKKNQQQQQQQQQQKKAPARKKILRVDGDEKVPERRIGSEVVWIDSSSFLFTRLDESLRAHEVWRCDIVQPPEGSTPAVTRETLIFREHDLRFTVCALERSEDDSVVCFSTESKTTSEVWYLPLLQEGEDSSDRKFRCFLPRQEDFEYSVFHHRSLFLPTDFPEPKSKNTSADVEDGKKWVEKSVWLVLHNAGDARRDFQLDVVPSTDVLQPAPAAAASASSTSSNNQNKQVNDEEEQPPAASEGKENQVKETQPCAAAADAEHRFERTEALLSSPSLLQPFVQFDARYAIENLTTFKDFIIVEVRRGGFPQVLLFSNAPRTTNEQHSHPKELWKQRGLFELSSPNHFLHFTVSLPKMYSEWVNSLAAYQQQQLKKKNKNSSGAAAGKTPSAPSSPSAAATAAADDAATTMGYEQDPELLSAIDLITGVVPEGVSMFRDRNTRVTVTNPLFPLCELELEIEPTVPVPTCKQHLHKFSAVPHGKNAPRYDPSKYGLKLEFVTATQSTCAADPKLNLLDEEGKILQPQIPVVIKFRKDLCDKYVAEQKQKQQKQQKQHMAEEEKTTEPASDDSLSNNPCILTGYAAYGCSAEHEFCSSHISLMDRGIVMAECSPRGGGEHGKKWYNSGKMEHKINSFTDFIDVSEWLSSNEAAWCHRDRLAIRGASAGGLLVGAVTHLRPDIYRAVSANCPFVDVISCMFDASIPLTVAEWLEWGNPASDPEILAAMAQYSPIDLLCKGEQSENPAERPSSIVFPHMFIESGVEDARVQVHEPLAWSALLRDNWQASAAADRVLVHWVNTAGHEGGSGRFESLRELAREYAFLLTALGVAVKKPV